MDVEHDTCLRTAQREETSSLCVATGPAQPTGFTRCVYCQFRSSEQFTQRISSGCHHQQRIVLCIIEYSLEHVTLF